MKHTHKNSLREMQSLCADVRPEDGLAPHLLKQQERRQQRAEHPPGEARIRQYCKAVQRSLESGLSSVCGDERLKDLSIHSVEPMRGAAHLLVVVIAPPEAGGNLLPLEQTLQNAAGLLRSVVANEIQRKRAPHLTFRVVPAS